MDKTFILQDISHNDLISVLKKNKYTTINLYDYQYFDIVIFNYLNVLEKSCTNELHIYYKEGKPYFIKPKIKKIGIDKRIKNLTEEYERFSKNKSWIHIIDNRLDPKFIKIYSYILKNIPNNDINVLNVDLYLYKHYSILFINHDVVKLSFINNLKKICNCYTYKNYKFTFNDETLSLQRFFKFQQNINFCFANKYIIPIIYHTNNLHVPEQTFKYIVVDYNIKPILGIYKHNIKNVDNLINCYKKTKLIINVYREKKYDTYYMGNKIAENVDYDINKMLLNI